MLAEMQSNMSQVEKNVEANEQTLILESTLPPELHSEFVTKYLRDKELEKMPERNHTEVLNEQLQKAAEEMSKTYKLANKG